MYDEYLAWAPDPPVYVPTYIVATGPISIEGAGMEKREKGVEWEK